LKAILDKAFTDEQRKEAKETFNKALDRFVESGADITAHPLAEMLKAEEMPEVVTSIVKALYTSQLKTLTKDIAESMLRPGSSEAGPTFAVPAPALQRPVFDAKALPREITAPTATEASENARKAAEQATRDMMSPKEKAADARASRLTEALKNKGLLVDPDRIAKQVEGKR
jgi:hypothetical protein